MKRLTETSFFRLLQENENNVSVLQQEYENFALFVFAEEKTASDKTDYHNTLVYTFVELTWLSSVANKNATIFVEKAHELIDREIELLEREIVASQMGVQCPLTQNKVVRKVLQWTGEPVELVELLYALHEAGCFGKVFLKNLFDDAGKLFGVEISNYYRLFWGSKTRVKGDRTTFLDKLKKALTNKIEKSEGKPPKK
jgi:hypothetical protein